MREWQVELRPHMEVDDVDNECSAAADNKAPYNPGVIQRPRWSMKLSPLYRRDTPSQRKWQYPARLLLGLTMHPAEGVYLTGYRGHGVGESLDSQGQLGTRTWVTGARSQACAQGGGRQASMLASRQAPCTTRGGPRNMVHRCARRAWVLREMGSLHPLCMYCQPV